MRDEEYDLEIRPPRRELLPRIQWDVLERGITIAPYGPCRYAVVRGQQVKDNPPASVKARCRANAKYQAMLKTVGLSHRQFQALRERYGAAR